MRAWSLWHRIADGKVVDAETGDERWAIDWSGFRAACESQHPLTTEDDHADLFDGMVEIRTVMNTPNGELMFELMHGDND